MQDAQPVRAANGQGAGILGTGSLGKGRPPALTVRECCASLSFWLLFAVFGTGTGLGLMFVNNLGEPCITCCTRRCSAP